MIGLEPVSVAVAEEFSTKGGVDPDAAGVSVCWLANQECASVPVGKVTDG
jgi:hypothetical protein